MLFDSCNTSRQGGMLIDFNSSWKDEPQSITKVLGATNSLNSSKIHPRLFPYPIVSFQFGSIKTEYLNPLDININ